MYGPGRGSRGTEGRAGGRYGVRGQRGGDRGGRSHRLGRVTAAAAGSAGWRGGRSGWRSRKARGGRPRCHPGVGHPARGGFHAARVGSGRPPPPPPAAISGARPGSGGTRRPLDRRLAGGATYQASLSGDPTKVARRWLVAFGFGAREGSVKRSARTPPHWGGSRLHSLQFHPHEEQGGHPAPPSVTLNYSIYHTCARTSDDVHIRALSVYG